MTQEEINNIINGIGQAATTIVNTFTKPSSTTTSTTPVFQTTQPVTNVTPYTSTVGSGSLPTWVPWVVGGLVLVVVLPRLIPQARAA